MNIKNIIEKFKSMMLNKENKNRNMKNIILTIITRSRTQNFQETFYKFMRSLEDGNRKKDKLVIDLVYGNNQKLLLTFNIFRTKAN
jgi:hypothetical protein